MRYALAFTPLLWTLASGCSSETVTGPPPPPVDWASLAPRPPSADAGTPTATSRERGTVDAYMKALASPGFADLGRVLDEDAHFAFAGFKDVHGKDNVIHVHQALLGAFSPRSFVASRVLMTDDAQIVEWTMSGVHERSHKPVTFRGVTLLWTKDDGTVSDLHLYFDEAIVNGQLGVGPKALQTLPPPPFPSSPQQTIEKARSPEESANVGIVRAALDAVEAKNESAYVASMADDVEITTLEGPKPMRGKVEARAYVRAMHKAIAQLDTAVDNLWGIGDLVVVEYHVVGEQRGPIGWVPAQKDTLVKMFVVDIAELHDGRITHVRRYDNPAQLLADPR